MARPARERNSTKAASGPTGLLRPDEKGEGSDEFVPPVPRRKPGSSFEAGN